MVWDEYFYSCNDYVNGDCELWNINIMEFIKDFLIKSVQS